MAIFNDFPYSNLHNENLSWIVGQLKKLNAFIENNPNLDPSGFEKELEEIKSSITNLENSLSTTDGNIDTINTTITQINKNIESINSKISAISDSVEDANSNISALTAEISKVKNSMPNVGFYNTSYVVYVGDSYTAGPGSTDGKGWPDRLTAILPVGTRTYTVWNGGGGFTRLGDAGTMTQAINSANIPDATTVSLVICVAGINDADNSDTYTGVKNFISECRTKMPAAKIIIAGSPAPYVQNYTKYINIASSAVASGESYCDIIYINLSVNNAYKSASDDIHLNNAGYQNCAQAILAYMRGSRHITARQTKTTSKNGVSITARSNSDGLWIQAAGTLTENNTSGAFENVVDLGCRPKTNIQITGGYDLITADASGKATYTNSCYLLPTGALAIPGASLKGCKIDMYFKFIPWVAFTPY